MPVDKSIRKKVRHLVNEEKITNVAELKEKVKHFVEKTLELKINNKNRKFHPTDKDIRNAKHDALPEDEGDDQETTQEKVNNYLSKNPSDNLFYRPRNDKNGILMCHQTSFQKHLLNRYGNELTSLDATYKTTMYLLSLFFVCVKTNSSYQVVGWFLTQTETESDISEALSFFRGWNPLWKPRFCMTDYCVQEIRALEGLFPGNNLFPFY